MFQAHVSNVAIVPARNNLLPIKVEKFGHAFAGESICHLSSLYTYLSGVSILSPPYRALSECDQQL